MQRVGLIGKLLKLDLRPLKFDSCINTRDLVLLSPVRVLNALKLELWAFFVRVSRISRAFYPIRIRKCVKSMP